MARQPATSKTRLLLDDQLLRYHLWNPPSLPPTAQHARTSPAGSSSVQFLTQKRRHPRQLRFGELPLPFLISQKSPQPPDLPRQRSLARRRWRDWDPRISPIHDGGHGVFLSQAPPSRSPAVHNGTGEHRLAGWAAKPIGGWLTRVVIGYASYWEACSQRTGRACGETVHTPEARRHGPQMPSIISGASPAATLPIASASGVEAKSRLVGSHSGASVSMRAT
jgi:hypothetical protein